MPQKGAMSAATLTFEQIESRADSTVAWAIHARRVRDGVFACVICAPLVLIVKAKLHDLTRHLSSDVLEGLTDEQARKLADLLQQLSVRLTEINTALRDTGLCRFRILSAVLEKMESSHDDVDSIIENLRLSLNKDFRGAVSSAIDQLKIGVENRAPVLR